MSVHLLPLQDGEPVEVPEGLTLLGRDRDCDWLSIDETEARAEKLQ